MSTKICLVVLFSMIATQVSRLSPMFISSKFHMSEKFESWLKFIPVAVLTALIVPEFFQGAGDHIGVNPIFLISGIAAFIVGLWRRNLLLTTIVGVVSVTLLQLILV